MKTGAFLPTVFLAVAVAGFAVAAYVFVEVQVLESYPFHAGVYGTEVMAAGLTYTQALELSACAASAGLFARSYLRSGGTWKTRGVKALGSTLFVAGVVIALVVYVETRLLWGEILPGVRVWSGLAGGGGYPWGGEQVAYNTCLVASNVAGDCAFLSYDELFWIALLSAVAGYVLRGLGPAEETGRGDVALGKDSGEGASPEGKQEARRALDARRMSRLASRRTGDPEFCLGGRLPGLPEET